MKVNSNREHPHARGETRAKDVADTVASRAALMQTTPKGALADEVKGVASALRHRRSGMRRRFRPRRTLSSLQTAWQMLRFECVIKDLGEDGLRGPDFASVPFVFLGGAALEFATTRFAKASETGCPWWRRHAYEAAKMERPVPTNVRRSEHQ